MPDLRRYLRIRTAASPTVTADDAWLVVVSDLTGLPQAWAAPAEGGWPHQLTFADDRVQWVAASPTAERTVVFGRDTEGDERTQLHRIHPEGTGERPLTDDPATVHRFGAFTPDGTEVVFTANARNGVDFDCYRQALDGGPPRLVAKLSGSTRVARITPDGRQALLHVARSPLDADLALLDLDSGEQAPLTPAPGRHLPADFTHDGRWLVLASDMGGEFTRAGRLDTTTGEWTPFGPTGRDVDEVAVRGGSGAMSVNDDGRSRLLSFDPDTLATTGEIDLPPGVASELAVAPDGGRVLFTFTGPAHPQAVWEADTRESVPARQVTRPSTAGIDPASFVQPATERVEAHDGRRIPVLVWTPPHLARPPAVVSVHGGPEAQERPRFSWLYQYLLARGIAVVAPNVRGSTGYGRSYTALDDRERRPDAVADLAAVGRWAADHPHLSGAPAVMGASYGGYLTLAGLASCPGLFAAGVSIVGMADLVGFLERTSPYRRALREAEYGTLERHRELLAELSPIHRIEEVDAPLLVIHGANDPRVPVSEATGLVACLRAAGGAVECLLFDDEGHGIVRPGNRERAYAALADFLERHLA